VIIAIVTSNYLFATDESNVVEGEHLDHCTNLLVLLKYFVLMPKNQRIIKTIKWCKRY